jgi:hypothetical protein
MSVNFTPIEEPARKPVAFEPIDTGGKVAFEPIPEPPRTLTPLPDSWTDPEFEPRPTVPAPIAAARAEAAQSDAAAGAELAGQYAGQVRMDPGVTVLPRVADDPLGTAGRALGRAGDMAAGATADVLEAASGAPTTRNLGAAWERKPLPIEQDLAAAGGWTELLGKPILSVARMAPYMAASGGLTAAGAPAAAAVAAPMALKPSGDVSLTDGLIAFAIPTVSRYGRDLGGKAFAKAIGETKVVFSDALSDLGPLATSVEGRIASIPGLKELARPIVAKGIETLSAGTLTTAYLMAASAPEILSLPEGQRAQATRQAMADNLAMAMLGLPEVFSKLPPQASRYLKITPERRPVKPATEAKPAAELPAAPEPIKSTPAETASTPVDNPAPQGQAAYDADTGRNSTPSPEAPGHSPESTAAVIRRGASSIQAAQPDRTHFSAQFEALVSDAQERGLILPESALPAEIQSHGQEHQVWASPDGRRVFKATFPNRFGLSLSGQANPLEYFERLRLANEVFGDDIRFEGLVQRRDKIQVLTSQPLIEGPHPSSQAVADHLEGMGFRQVDIDRTPVWYRPEDNILLSDAHTRNFVETPQGVVPIDVNLAQPEGELQARLKALYIEAPGPDAPAAPAAAADMPDAQAELVSQPARAIPAGQIALRPDLMQFKRVDDTEAGTNAADQLSGAWDDLKAGTLLLWQPKDPAQYGLQSGQRYIVANGHHRYAFGAAQGVKGFNAQIVREADGVSAADARSLGAEINIADGKGTIYDQAKFIRNERATYGADAALARARQIGAKARKAAAIALEAGADLYTSFINEQISPDQTEAIAHAAPADDATQRLGILQARKGASPADLANYIQAVRVATAGRAEQLDMFGSNDAAIAQAEAMAARASGFQRQIAEQIRAVQGAAKRPEQAAALGVNVADPQGVLRRIAQLKTELERWQNWPMHPDLVRAVQTGEPPQAPPAAAGAAPAGPLPDQIEMFMAEPGGEPGAAPAQPGPAAGPEDAPPSPPEDPAAAAYAIQFAKDPARPGLLPVKFGGMEHVFPIEFPELLRFWRELTGKLPLLRKLPKALGLFRAKGDQFEIVLDPGIFKDADTAAKVLAHEIGHGTDFFPDMTLARGNIFGRIGSMRNWLASTFPLSPDIPLDKVLKASDRAQIRRKAEAEIGGRPPKDEEADLAAWRAAVAEKYQEMIVSECERRGLTQLQEATDELRNLTGYWTPFPDNPPESYVKYRFSSRELYADALSVMFNNPGLLQERAPLFWKMFWNWLDKKPEVKAEFFEIQRLLESGQRNVIAEREKDLEAMFAKGEDILKRKAEERKLRRTVWRGYWLDVKRQLHDHRADAVNIAQRIERAGGTVDPAQDPRKFFEEEAMADNTASRLVRRVFEGVVQPLEANGISTDQLGFYLVYNRILADRSEMANPGGLNPLAARKGLLKLRLDLGMGKMTILEAGARRFHDIVFEVTQDAVEAGVYNRETFDKTIAPNKYSYATYAVLDYLQDFIPAGIKQQVGTLKDIANPLTATLLKTISLIHLNAVNRSKTATVQLIAKHFPDEIKPAETFFDGKGQSPRPNADFGVVTVLQNGVAAHWWVDPEIAKGFEHLTPGGWDRILRPLRIVFESSFYPLWITYNAAFQIANVKRDFSRTRRSLGAFGGPGGFRLTGAYLRAVGPAIRRLRGIKDPLIEEMVANFAIDPADASFGHGFAERDDFIQNLMERYHLAPLAADRQGVRGKIRQMVNWLKCTGNLAEALPRIAGYRLTREQMHLAPRDASVIVRNYVGTPNTRRRGRSIYVMKPLIPFWNVFEQGITADVKLASNPKTRFGWWWRWAAWEGAMALLMASAASGLLGEYLKRLFDGVSEYDKTNYGIIPLGEEAGGDFGSKTVYIRIPRDETSRLVSGLFYKFSRALLAGDMGGISEAFAFGAGQVPTVNPLLSIGSAWSQYVFNRNPVDAFRGRPVIPPTEWAAGGWDRLKPMLIWTYNQTGLQDFVRLSQTRKDSAEWTLDNIPVLHRFLKISDQGYREQQQDEASAEDTFRAQHKLRLPDNARALNGEYYGLNKIPRAKLTPEQTKRLFRLRAWYNDVYRPIDEAIRRAEAEGSRYTADSLRTRLGEASQRFER